MSFTVPKKVAILNSRQSLRPKGEDLWIVNTKKAIEGAIRNNYIIIASVGMNAWEIPLHFASKLGARINLVVPLYEGDSFLEVQQNYCGQFHLEVDTVGWIPIKLPCRRHHKDTFLRNRDEMVLDMANIIFPVSIRTGGNLEELIDEQSRRGVDINCRFETKYDRTPSECKIDIDTARVSPGLDSLLENYLIHWTRSTSSPWPDETAFQFYEDIIMAKYNYPRSAYQTLVRILRRGKIIGSNRHMRKGVPAVSFSDTRPSEAVKLMRWRARYQEMSFEPYGIAIERNCALHYGVRKVFYGNPEMYRYLDDRDKRYFQNLGKEGYWMPENEYRYVGDFDLRQVPSDKITAVVWRKEETEKIPRSFVGRVISIYD